MKIQINPLTVVMFAVVAFTANLKLYLLAYFVMALHELSHLCAALFIGLKPQSITFSPFGVHLRLDSKIINSVTDEVILYLAGPFVNAVFALIALFFDMPDLYRLNTVLFVINILPIVPLDGGMITVRLLSCRFGRKRSKSLLNAFSFVLGVAMLIVSLYSVYIGYINISLFIIAVLFIGNIFTGKEMYDTDFINAISCTKKRTNKTNVVVIDSQHTIADAVKNFSPAFTTIALVIDENDKISGILSEKEILQSIDGYKNIC